MENYYQVLAIDRKWPLNQIQSYLQSEQYVWDNLAQTRRDHQSILKSKLGRKAQKIFSTLASKEQYDKALAAFLNPKQQIDPRQLKCDQLFKKAKDFLKKKELDLAEESISQALSYREEGNVEVLQLAAYIYDKLEKVSQAFSCINKAIVEKPDNLRTYHLKLSVLMTDYFLIHKQKFSSEEQRERAQKALYSYLFGGFERDMNPTTAIQRLKVYDRIREKYQLLYQGETHEEFEELCRRYRQLALRVGEISFYDSAVVFDEFTQKPILIDTTKLKFCQEIMAKSNDSVRAKEFINLYNRAEKEYFETVKKHQAEKENALKAVATIEQDYHQISKEINEVRERIKSLEDKRKRLLNEKDAINVRDEGGCLGCFYFMIIPSLLLLVSGLNRGDRFIFWEVAFVLFGIPLIFDSVRTYNANSDREKRKKIDDKCEAILKQRNELEELIDRDLLCKSGNKYNQLDDAKNKLNFYKRTHYLYGRPY